MKNQYFGDIRDIFKFDLIESILRDKRLGLRSFLYIIMLTKDRGNGGLIRNYDRAKEQKRPGTQNDPLFEEMKKQEAIPSHERDIAKTTRAYYKGAVPDCEYKAISDPLEKTGHINKNYLDYFDMAHKEVSKLKLPALIFLDPDTGLEPEKSKGYEYVSYETIRRLYDIISDDSALMIYQHGRQQHDRQRHDNKIEALQAIGPNVSHVSDGEIVFYFLVKNARLKEALNNILQEYKGYYPSWILL